MNMTQLSRAEGLEKHAVQAKLFWIAKLFEAECHAIVTGGRLGAVGAKKSVPDREIESEVAVGFMNDDGMVDAVHVGRHEQSAEEWFHGFGNTNIAVIEQGGGIQEHFEQKCAERRYSKRQDRAEFDQQRN